MTTEGPTMEIKLREALADLCGLRETISDDVEAFDIGRHPETGEWRVWHEDYPDEGSMRLEAARAAPSPQTTPPDHAGFEALLDLVCEAYSSGRQADGEDAAGALLSAIAQAVADAERRAEEAERENDRHVRDWYKMLVAVAEVVDTEGDPEALAAEDFDPWEALRQAKSSAAALSDRVGVLEGALRGVLEGMPHHVGGLRGSAPGHAHAVPGIWDDDNGAKAGAPCEWCATWEAARTLIDAGARASRAAATTRCTGRCHCHAGPDGLMHPPCCGDCAPGSAAREDGAPGPIRWMGDDTQDADVWELSRRPDRFVMLGGPTTLYFVMDDRTRIVVPRGWWIYDWHTDHPRVSSAAPAPGAAHATAAEPQPNATLNLSMGLTADGRAASSNDGE